MAGELDLVDRDRPGSGVGPVRLVVRAGVVMNGARRMFRYTVPVDDQPWIFDLTGDPVHVASGATLDEVDFWAEYTDGAPRKARRFQVFGTGHALPPGARWGRHLPAGERPGLAPVRTHQRRGGPVMGDVLLNGRPALDFEVAAIERAREQERQRALVQLAGVLTDPGPEPDGVPRPAADLMCGFR